MIIFDFFKGILIGIANVVPGLSGATIAVVLNIYERLINFFSNLFTKPWKAIKDTWAIILGIAVGIVLSLFGISYLVQKFPVATLTFIVGLILGGIPKIFKEIEHKKPKAIDIILFILMIAIIIILPFLQSENVTNIDVDFKIVILLVLLGAVSSGAMIIPGVSGSMVLLALGYYLFIVTTFEDAIKVFFTFNFTVFFKQLLVIIPFGIGVLIGLVLISKLIKYLLSKYYQTVIYAILGLLIASPAAVIYSMLDDPQIGGIIKQSMYTAWIVGGVMIFLGAFVSVYLSKLDEKIQKR